MWKVRTESGCSGNTVCRLGVVSSLVLKAIIHWIFSIIWALSLYECCELFLFTPALAAHQVKIVGEALTVCSHEQSTKELSRKERGGCERSGRERGWPWLFALCVGEWESRAALLDAPLPANVFGKDGAAVKAMERSHGVALPGEGLFWRRLYILELLKCFTCLSVVLWCLGSITGASQSVGWCMAASALQVLCPHHRWAPLKESQSLWGAAGSVLRAAVVGETWAGQTLRTLRPVFRVISVHSLQSFFFFLLLKHCENTLRLIWGSQRFDTISLQPWLCPRS